MQTKSFKDHFHSPLNQGKPVFFQSYVSLDLDGINVTIYLDVDSKERIQNLQYVYQGAPIFLPYFSVLTELVKGMNIEQAKKVGHENFKVYFQNDSEFQSLEDENQTPWLNPALIMLKKVIEDYEGTVQVPYSEMKKEKPSELICRCFGIYKNEIVKLITDNTNFELKDVTLKTKAGAGCRSCQVDIDEIYFETRELHPLKKQVDSPKSASNYKIQNKSTAQWVIEIDKAIKSFLITNSLEKDLIEIEKFKFPELRLKVTNAPEKLSLEKLEEKLSYYLEQSISLKVKIIWKI